MAFLTYNQEITDGPNITGVYTERKLIKGNQSFILVNQSELRAYRNNPNGFHVINETLTVRKDTADLARMTMVGQRKQRAKNTILSTVVVDNREYTPDIPFQINLTLALHIATHDKETRPSFWCKIDDQWVHREHTHQELLAIAAELLKRREAISASLYKI
jgi:hypothetical protein